MEQKPYIEHWVFEIADIPKETCDKIQNFKPYADVYVKQLNLQEVDEFSQQLEPYGITLIKILRDSHIAFHSWPDNNYLHIDLLTCVELDFPKEELQFITEEVFEAESVNIKKID